MSRDELWQMRYEKQMNQLIQRPSIEDAEARYTQMQEEIKASVTAVVPSVQWQARREPGLSNCAEFTTTWAQNVRMPLWGAKGSIPEDLWPEALTAVAKVTSRYGFTNPSHTVDRPGDHDVRMAGDFGGYLDFGFRVDVTLGIHAGCYLPQNLKSEYLAGNTTRPTR